MVSITINDKELHVADGTTVLEATGQEGIRIPTLCYSKALGHQGFCRLCVVEAEGPGLNRTILPSCNLSVFEGLVIDTNTPLIQSIRKTIVELLLANTQPHSALAAIAEELGADTTKPRSAVQDPCILCGLCIRVCRCSAGASALSFARTEKNPRVIAGKIVLDTDACIGCGTCANICPVQAIRVEDRQSVRSILIYDKVANEIELAACDMCGSHHATHKFIESVRLRLDPEQRSALKNLCPECARLCHADALAGQFPPDQQGDAR